MLQHTKLNQKMNQIEQKIQLLSENLIRMQACKYLIWVGFVVLMGMFCAIHYVWFKMPLTLINIVFYIGVNCWFVVSFYILNETYKLLKKDIKFFESKLKEC